MFQADDRRAPSGALRLSGYSQTSLACGDEVSLAFEELQRFLECACRLCRPPAERQYLTQGEQTRRLVVQDVGVDQEVQRSMGEALRMCEVSRTRGELGRHDSPAPLSPDIVARRT